MNSKPEPNDTGTESSAESEPIATPKPTPKLASWILAHPAWSGISGVIGIVALVITLASWLDSRIDQKLENAREIQLDRLQSQITDLKSESALLSGIIDDLKQLRELESEYPEAFRMQFSTLLQDIPKQDALIRETLAVLERINKYSPTEIEQEYIQSARYWSSGLTSDPTLVYSNALLAATSIHSRLQVLEARLKTLEQEEDRLLRER
ncbi:MAG: hypothetical protein HUJ26_12970 [Planctomycetaceae bacterium]|nr:hypothetical protein [Planctomycetaceae bacterium]